MGSPEQAIRRPSWARPLIFFLAAITLILYASISQIAGSLYFHLAGHEGGHSLAAQRFSSDLISSAQSPAADSREDLAKVLKTTSDFLDTISREYHLDSLKSFSKDLRKHAADAHKSTLIAAASKELEARGFLEDLGNLVTGGGKGGGASGASAGATGAAAMSGITGIFGKLLGGLGNITLGALADPAQYLGDGVGRGVTAGLKVTNNAVTSAQKPTGLNAIADNLGFGVANGLTGSLDLSTLTSGGTLGAASNALGAGLGGGAATGLNLNTTAVPVGNQTGVALIAGNLGNGLTSSFFKSASLSSLMTGINGTQVASAITNAGKGLGEGAAQGLKLPTAAVAKRAATTSTAAVSSTNAANSSIDIASVAYEFTKSLSSSFLGSVDVSKLVSSASGSMSNITGMITPALVGAGSGFGSGAAVGFGLQSEVASVTSADDNASTVGKNFAYQLTTSFLANGTVDGLSKALKSAGMTNVTAMIGPAAQGAGSGIGQGVAVGLGLQQAASSTSGGDIAMVARDFTYGLTSSFLANDTVAQIQKAASNFSAGSSFSLSSLSISKVAEGAARGFIDGAGDSINNAGGVQAILGTSKVENPMSTSSSIFGDSSGFNDSVSGAATGFGYGLGAEGVNVVLIAIGKKTAPAPSTTPDAVPAPPETTGNLSTVAARSLAPGTKVHFPKRGLEPGKKSTVQKRAIDLSGIFASINSSDVNSVLQKGVDSLTCEGVGGATQIFAGLKSSGTLPTTTTLPPGILPNATFTLFSGGNKFVIDPKNFGIFVNGLTINKLTILIVFHAFLVILAYFVFIPLALSLEYGHAIAVLIVRPQKLLNAPRWKTFIWALGVLPLAIVGFILGIVLLGSASHFITPHGIIGFVTTIIMFIAAALETPVGKNLKPLRFIVLSLLILLSIIAFVTGFADIQRISLCTVQLPDAAFLVVSILVSISLVSGVTIFLVYWIMKKWLGIEGAVDYDMKGRLIEKNLDVKVVEVRHLGPNPKARMPSLSDDKSYQR